MSDQVLSIVSQAQQKLVIFYYLLAQDFIFEVLYYNPCILPLKC